MFLLIRASRSDGVYSAPGPSAPYAYNFVLLALFVPYGMMLRSWQRGGRPPSPRAVVLGAGVVWLLLLVAPPVQSRDVYQYLFYGRMEIVHDANPYLAEPRAFSADPWFHTIGWPGRQSVYGPLWTFAVARLVAVSGSRLLPSLLLVKGLAVGLAGIAVAGLSRLSGPARDGVTSQPARSMAFFALNPLVMTTVALGGHADAAVAASLVWAIVFDRQGRPLAASIALAAGSLVKAYAALPLLVYLFVRWRRAGAAHALKLAAAGLGLATAAYATYWRGLSTLRGLLSAGEATSSSLAGLLERGANAALRGVGLAAHEAVAHDLVRGLAATAMVATAAALVRSPRTLREPWRAGLLLLLAFTAVTPWFLPWYLIGLVAMAAAVEDPTLAACVGAFSGSCLVTASWLGGAGQALIRYGVPLATAGSVRRASAGDPRGPDRSP